MRSLKLMQKAARIPAADAMLGLFTGAVSTYTLCLMEVNGPRH
ncbi:MAG TPA: hypothetical protein VIB00_01670 [Pyrinomonadaceae bacterium]